MRVCVYIYTHIYPSIIAEHPVHRWDLAPARALAGKLAPLQRRALLHLRAAPLCLLALWEPRPATGWMQPTQHNVNSFRKSFKMLTSGYHCPLDLVSHTGFL